MNFDNFHQATCRAAEPTPLSTAEMSSAMMLMLSGTAAQDDIASFLLALKARGETPTEIMAAAQIMRQKATSFSGPVSALDTCGTGGDGAHTFNISTTVAFVLAGCGVPLAKHGNKAVSSASGSSEVLAALGVNLAAPLNVVQACLHEIGITFLFAQRHHPAVQHVAAVRARLKVRTLFNLLGPLANPAGAKYQLLGVYEKTLTTPMAQALKGLGTISAWVVHGADGLDELTITGPSHVSALTPDGRITNFVVTPEEAGLACGDPAALVGGDPQHNAAALQALLAGATDMTAYRNIVLLNAAAGLVVAGKVPTLRAGVCLAEKAIDSGAAGEKLSQLVRRTNEATP